ncbi:hypothetical protein AB0H43_10535 [Hamadaea sp. NPDC050747]|uniref:hypothetical protein n=1 Tax=Hamadaea sp. NPDC050747 TaxID=3155789 RepID=UPI0033E1753B
MTGQHDLEHSCVLDGELDDRSHTGEIRTCAAHGCGARYDDDPAGYQAHSVVFGHQPRSRR